MPAQYRKKQEKYELLEHCFLYVNFTSAICLLTRPITKNHGSSLGKTLFKAQNPPPPIPSPPY